MKKILLAITWACLFTSCKNDTVATTSTADTSMILNRLDEVDWVIGTWEMPAPKGQAVFTEHWEKINDTTLSGQGAMVNSNGDTSFREYLQLANINDTLWYIPTIADQNNGSPVRFREKSLSENEVVFENAAHDFPQRIIYQRKGEKTIYARVEGMQNNSMRKEEFTFSKK